ncbi:MAG TPA: ceramidase domain-containing protein, partial [Burkholderiales bacterium]|nr:ceramidase domain-containing protein [Burkholderiales bacterium]
APPIPQPEAYHAFADRRALFGVPNFADVISSFAFVLVGAMGLLARNRIVAGEARRAYLLVFAAILLTGVGSAYYHLAPDNARLVWDRLPMAIGFMAFLSAMLAERVSFKLGSVLLAPLVLTAIASVVYWYVSELAGRGDLRPYIFVQLFPLLAAPVLIALFPARYTHGGDLLGMAALYGLAKLCELYDAQIFELGRILSGHTLKHLIAAFALVLLLRMLLIRRPAQARI